MVISYDSTMSHKIILITFQVHVKKFHVPDVKLTYDNYVLHIFITFGFIDIQNVIIQNEMRSIMINPINKSYTLFK